jgi:catechol 2,3-dioxygenase-like lactoylglutathione lyase family enzyme
MSDTSPSLPGRVYFETSNPILRVEDMQIALEFYVSKLGFTNAPWGNNDFTCVTRDRAGLYLSRGDHGRGEAWCWIGVEDTLRLHQEFKVRGVEILMPPRKYSWALEMHVADPDGNVLRFASDPK